MPNFTTKKKKLTNFSVIEKTDMKGQDYYIIFDNDNQGRGEIGVGPCGLFLPRAMSSNSVLTTCSIIRLLYRHFPNPSRYGLAPRYSSSRTRARDGHSWPQTTRADPDIHQRH